MLMETLDSVRTFAQVVGVGLISYTAYELWNKYGKDDNENKMCDWNELKSLMGAGVLVSKNVRLSVKQSVEHLLMVAPSGCGKSRRFYAHQINNDNLRNCSIVVTDPSGELEKMCKTSKKKYILNPFSDRTIGYNPLLNCHNEFEVRKLADVILTNGMKANQSKNSNSDQQEWVSMAIPLLTSYMLMNYYTKKYSFPQMIQNICTKYIVPVVTERDKEGNATRGVVDTIQTEIFESNVESAIIEFQSFKQVMGAAQTLSSIRIVMNTCLKVFLDKNVKSLLNKENIDISQIRKEESVIFIQIPEEHADYFSPIIATFLTQTFDYLLRNDGLPVYFLLDEFASCCGFISSITKLLSIARKHDISIVAAIQSLIQLSSLYGEIQGKELTDLFKTLLVCGGLKDSSEYISNLLGTEEYRENDVTKTRPLMTPDEVRRLKDDEMLIICKNKRPVKDKMMEIVR